jgi:hypothetical protein
MLTRESDVSNSFPGSRAAQSGGIFERRGSITPTRFRGKARKRWPPKTLLEDRTPATRPKLNGVAGMPPSDRGKQLMKHLLAILLLVALGAQVGRGEEGKPLPLAASDAQEFMSGVFRCAHSFAAPARCGRVPRESRPAAAMRAVAEAADDAARVHTSPTRKQGDRHVNPLACASG